MRRYDEPVEVRRDGDQGPAMFLWRGRVWKVRDVVARWVETGAWWESPGAGAVLGTEEAASVAEVPARSGAGDTGVTGVTGNAGDTGGGVAVVDDLLAEREVWRVLAGRGAHGQAAHDQGVFDLSLDWADGRWRLVSCAD